MKQAGFPWFNEAQAPRDVAAAFVLACTSQAEAVTQSLAIAKRLYGLTRKQVAKSCGWKSSSFLSEIAKGTDGKTMPEERIEAFCKATGCNLLAQYLDRVADQHRLAGKLTERERQDAIAAACIAQWERAA
jgi:hypothetical protein